MTARQTYKSEDGFTLIELLVVILIIGILAAVAIPSFLSQRAKGQDACGKAMIKEMSTAMATYHLERDTYVGATPAALNAIESTIGTTGSDPCNSGWDVILTGGQASNAFCNGNAPAANNYCLFVPTPNNQGYRFYKAANGTITRTCVAAGKGGCSSAGTW